MKKFLLICLSMLYINASEVVVNNDKIELKPELIKQKEAEIQNLQNKMNNQNYQPSQDLIKKREAEIKYMQNKSSFQLKQFKEFKQKNEKDFNKEVDRSKNNSYDRVKQYESLMYGAKK